jgi:putative hemolysin
VLANGVFSGQIAVIAISKTRLAQLVEEGRSSARAVKRLRDAPEQFLATVQIGITVIGATAAAFGGASLARHIAPALAAIPGIGHYADTIRPASSSPRSVLRSSSASSS